jgi:type II secretory pathway component GspD/PulD (secretin)
MRMRRPYPHLLTAAALSCTLVGFAIAAPAPSDAKAADAAPAATMRERLNSPVTLQLREQSLRVAVDALRAQAKINIVLDSLTIQQQLGFTPDQPPVAVNIDLKEVPLRAALRRLLEPYSLSYAVVGDSVVVSTEDGAAAQQLRQPVSVDFDKVELSGALRRLARDTGAPLVQDSRAEKEGATKVSLQLEDVPLETAVRLLSEMAGLKPVRVGNVLFVTSKAVAQELRQDAPPPPNPAGVPADVLRGVTAIGVPAPPLNPPAPPGAPAAGGPAAPPLPSR